MQKSSLHVHLCIVSVNARRPIYHRRSQDFFSGVHFFPQKVGDLFSVVALKTQANTTK